MTATGAVPVPPIRKRNVDLYKPGTVARVVLTVALALWFAPSPRISAAGAPAMPESSSFAV